MIQVALVDWYEEVVLVVEVPINTTSLKGRMDSSSITATTEQLPYLLIIYLKNQNQPKTLMNLKNKKGLLHLHHFMDSVSGDWLERTKGIKHSLKVVTCRFDRKQSNRFCWMMVVAVK